MKSTRAFIFYLVFLFSIFNDIYNLASTSSNLYFILLYILILILDTDSKIDQGRVIAYSFLVLALQLSVQEKMYQDVFYSNFSLVGLVYLENLYFQLANLCLLLTYFLYQTWKTEHYKVSHKVLCFSTVLVIIDTTFGNYVLRTIEV